MASSTLRVPTTVPSTQVSIRKSSTAELAARQSRPFQVSWKGDSKLETPKSLTLTRRDAILGLTSLSTTATAICSPQIAEARIMEAEMFSKIKETIEMLIEKVGLSKRKENDEEKLPPVPPPSTKE